VQLTQLSDPIGIELAASAVVAASGVRAGEQRLELAQTQRLLGEPIKSRRGQPRIALGQRIRRQGHDERT
jgi:hypothetical protein